jgi:ATP-binding cassette subfamily B protein
MCDMSKIGISIQDILDCTKRLGMFSKAVNITIEDIQNMPLPGILFWNQNHFVVLYKIDRKHRKYYVADPAQGKIVFSEENFKRYWLGDNNRGIVILVAPDKGFSDIKFEKDTHRKGIINMMKETVFTHRCPFAMVIIFTIVALCAEIALPLLFQQTVDRGIASKDIGLVWMFVLGQLLVFVGSYVSNIVVELIVTHLGLNMSIRMMRKYLTKLINLPLSFFDRKQSSDLIQKAEDQNRLKEFLLNTPTSAFFTFLTLMIFSGLMIYYNYKILLLFIGVTILSMGWSVLFMHKRKQIDYTYFSYASENRNNFYELVNGMPEIKTNSAQNIRVGIWNETQEKINKLTIKSTNLRIIMNGGVTFMTRIRDIAITGICATLVIKGTFTFGVMLTINYIVGRLSAPFSTLIASFSSVQDASMSYERLDEILNNEESIVADTEIGAEKDIELRNLSFKYAGSKSPMVLKNLNATIAYGKTTALVGASGCGKTTLIKLLMGFYDPYEGDIVVGDKSLRDINKDNWIGRCGVVMQNGYVFSDSVSANIALCDKKPDILRVKEAACLAQINSFIERMPMQYSTRIGATGVELSGGQKQRLLIARALYKNPEILMLDEATSSLDANNERLITENIQRMRKGKTMVVAAHRLSTVKNADKILYMEDGEIVEQGTHDELLALKGKYFQLVKNQLELDKND